MDTKLWTNGDSPALTESQGQTLTTDKLVYEFAQRFRLKANHIMLLWLAPRIQNLELVLKREYEERYSREKDELVARLTVEFDERLSQANRQVQPEASDILAT